MLPLPFNRMRLIVPILLLLGIGFLLFPGCASGPKGLKIKGTETFFPPGTIIHAASGQAVSVEEMMADLYSVSVVYVGEQHTQARHHAIQFEILKKLHARYPDLSLGMEMFDHTYQPVLNQWRQGRLTTDQFLRQTHWYANWKFDFEMYKEILLYVKNQGIALIALNVPPHIPPKIAVGGIDSLLPSDKAHLPATVDTSNEEHRAYVRSVFKHHPRRRLSNFEFFYQAQCVWEDAMAEAIAQNAGDRFMLVFAGNGHLRHRYGIPQRSYKRHQASYRTILPMPAGRSVEAAIADYIWVSPQTRRPHPEMPQ